jgi:DNA-binding NtrC family response regulator
MLLTPGGIESTRRSAIVRKIARISEAVDFGKSRRNISPRQRVPVLEIEQAARVLSIVERPLAALTGMSAAIQTLRITIRLVAGSDRPVLVTGPTGAGKELVVRAIHELGNAPNQPLFDVNCGAFAEALVEAQLFGHERGAYTGAESARAGYFEAVGSGTLFFDEIAELPAQLQSKLLRVLEERRFRSLGSLEDRHFRGRIVAATHVDLAERIAQGRFREDLYHRLNVLQVRVPSLEERAEDIPQLVATFAAQQAKRVTFNAEAMALLCARRWPGNVRELRNLIDRTSVLVEGAEVTAEDLERIDPMCAEARRAGAAPSAELDLTRVAERVLAIEQPGNKMELIEAALVQAALDRKGGNKTAAARLLGVHRKVVERQVEKHKLRV